MATVFYWKWGFLKRNVATELVKDGLATVYTDAGAEYGGYLKHLITAETLAKKNHKGMWKLLKSNQYESPSDYKKRVSNSASNGK